jgi:hypothetical protein
MECLSGMYPPETFCSTSPCCCCCCCCCCCSCSSHPPGRLPGCSCGVHGGVQPPARRRHVPAQPDVRGWGGGGARGWMQGTLHLLLTCSRSLCGHAATCSVASSSPASPPADWHPKFSAMGIQLNLSTPPPRSMTCWHLHMGVALTCCAWCVCVCSLLLLAAGAPQAAGALQAAAQQRLRAVPRLGQGQPRGGRGGGLGGVCVWGGGGGVAGPYP